MELNEKQIEELKDFVYKVSIDGHMYAIDNYSPNDTALFDYLCNCPAVDATRRLEKLMDKYGIEYS